MAKYYVRVSAYTEEEYEIEAKNVETAENEAYDQMVNQYGDGYYFEIEDACELDEEND